ncbi:hypothetical protein ACIBSW_11115 [Actinoplanes sp. NPDC049668]|uniref:hypothetical protein n=1 Tax=unclassified Actinoplanes TaxID=2626549 RepID=UPI0033B0FCBA
MSQTSTTVSAVDPSAGSWWRRRRLMIAAAVASVIGVVALVAQVRSNDEDRAVAATEAAIRHAADIGGPRGFTPADPVPLLLGDPPAYRHEERQGLDIGVPEATGMASGFVTAWVTTVPRSSSPAASCEAVSEWVRRMFDKPVEASETARSCRTSLQGQSDGEGLFATVAGGFTASGRYLAGAASRSLADEGTELSVVLSFEPPLNETVRTSSPCVAVCSAG